VPLPPRAIRTTPPTATPPATTAPKSTARTVKPTIAAVPAKVETNPAVHKQRRWALTLLILVIGAGAVTAGLKRRAR
jgi:hypothetical protein